MQWINPIPSYTFIHWLWKDSGILPYDLKEGLYIYSGVLKAAWGLVSFNSIFQVKSLLWLRVEVAWKPEQFHEDVHP